jgi:hypothetical protein
LLSLFQLLMPSLVLFQLEDIGQVGIREPLHLVLQADTCFAQILPSRLQFLREPVASLGALERHRNAFGMGQHFTQILPHQVIELMCRNEA